MSAPAIGMSAATGTTLACRRSRGSALDLRGQELLDLVAQVEEARVALHAGPRLAPNGTSMSSMHPARVRRRARRCAWPR